MLLGYATLDEKRKKFWNGNSVAWLGTLTIVHKDKVYTFSCLKVVQSLNSTSEHPT